MRAAPLLAAILLAAPLALPAPATAQPARGFTALDCAAGSQPGLREEIARLPAMTDAPPESLQRLCVTEIRLSAPAPFQRLVVFQAQGSYWCGTAGCSTFIYGTDPYGAWTDVSPQDTLTNAQDASIRVDATRASRGMPRLAVVTGGGGARPGVAEWGWVPRLGRYSD